MKNILEIIRKRNWHRQGGAAVLHLMVTPLFPAVEGLYQETGVSYGMTVAYSQKGLGNWYLEKTYLKEMGDHFLKKTKKELQEIKKEWKKRDNIFQKEVQKILSMDLKKLDEKKILQIYKKFYEINYSMWIPYVFCDAYDLTGENIIKERLEKQKITLTDQEIHIMLATEEPSWSQREKINLLKLNIEASKKKNFLHDNLFLAKVQKHRDTYYWYKNDYQKVWSLDLNYFLEKIQKGKEHPQACKQELEKIEQEQQQTKKNKKLIVKQKKIPKNTVELFDFFALITQWRDYRKRNNQISNEVLVTLLKALGEKRKIPLAAMLYTLPQEVLQETIPNKEILQKREEEGCIHLLIREEKPLLLEGKEVNDFKKELDKKLFNEIKELKGMVAFSGKVKGIVKIIRQSSDFQKFKQEKILVAQIT